MTIILYIDYLSQPSRAVLAFLKLNKIPFESKEIRIAKLEVNNFILRLDLLNLRRLTLSRRFQLFRTLKMVCSFPKVTRF